MLSEKNAVCKRWAEYCERLLNIEDNVAVIDAIGERSKVIALEELNTVLIKGEEVC